MSPQRRREHLIATALRLYSRHAPDGVSIDDIVAEADVSRALFYRYFTNIRELHLAALNSVVDELISRLSLPAEGTFGEQLHNAVAVFVSFVERYASSYTALLRSGSTIANSATDSLLDRVRNHVIDLICARTALTDPTPALLMTIRGWMSVVETTLLSWLEQPTLPREQLQAWLADQLLAMGSVTARHDTATAEQLGRVFGHSGHALTEW